MNKLIKKNDNYIYLITKNDNFISYIWLFRWLMLACGCLLSSRLMLLEEIRQLRPPSQPNSVKKMN